MSKPKMELILLCVGVFCVCTLLQVSRNQVFVNTLAFAYLQLSICVSHMQCFPF